MTPGFSVYLITDRRRVAAGGLAEALHRVLAAVPPGSVAVQLREKDLPLGEVRALGSEVVAAARERGAPLLVHASALEVAAELGADGVHLPDGAPTAEQVRALPWAAGWLVGASCHDGAGLERAAVGADFAVLGPVFPTAGKAEPGQEMGLARFGALVGAAALPVYALGGVDAARAPACLGAGAAGVAVIGAVWSALDPAEALARLLETARGPARPARGG